MVKLYHYTSKLNMEQILRSGWLRKSLKHPIGWINGEMLKNGAAFFTEKDPYNFSKEEIAQNNWGQGWKDRVKAGMVDAYIVLDAPEGSRDFIFDWDPAHNVVAHIGDLQLEKFDCLWGYTDLTFSLLSFNVHHATNVPKVAELLNANLSDIICLQECNDQVLQQILSALTTEYFYHNLNGSAILTRFKFEPIAESGWTDHRGFLTIWLPDIGLYLTCLHLDQKQERTRVGEVWDVMEARWANNLDPMILAGDFNSLKREDYNFEKWEEISKVRRKNSWEAPKTDLIKMLEEKNFIDCWSEVAPSAKSGPIATSRFNTRVDYVFQHESVSATWKCVRVDHLETDASDHNAVNVTFRRVV